MKKQGYSQGNDDYALFVKRNDDSVMIFLVYVDDMIATGDDDSEIACLKWILAIEFELKDHKQG